MAMGTTKTEAFWSDFLLGGLMDQAEENVLAHMDFPKEDWPPFRLTHWSC